MALRFFALVLLCAALLPRDGAAATITRGDDKPCSLHLSGQIGDGDYDRLTAFTGTSWDDLGEVRPYIGAICLDSPGGSLAEGVRLAQLIYDLGFSTRVGDGARCHSICAIMFMMGSQSSSDFYEASTGRTLHIGGDLAFHSPSLLIDQTRSYSGGELKQVYDLAIESALRIVQLAGARKPFTSEQMIHPGLIGEMLATPSEELFHITTVEQVLAWDIRLEGLPDNRLPQIDFQRQMICDNNLTRGVVRASQTGYGWYTPSTMTGAIFRFAPILGADRILRMDPPLENGATQIMSFHYLDLPSECLVRFKGEDAEVCGAAPKLNRTVGDCEREYLVQAPAETRLHPLTEFDALLNFETPADAMRTARCRLLSSDGTTLRDETCAQSVDLIADPQANRFRHTLRWSSGAVSVAEVELGRNHDPAEQYLYRLDGVAAEPFGDTDTCLRSQAIGRILCVEDP